MWTQFFVCFSVLVWGMREVFVEELMLFLTLRHYLDSEWVRGRERPSLELLWAFLNNVLFLRRVTGWIHK